MKNSFIGKNNKLSVGQQVGAFFGLILGFLLANYLDPSVMMVLLLPIFLGVWGAGWYLKRKKINQKIINVIVWSSLVTGLILPPFGLLTSSAAYTFGNKSEPKIKKYRIIGAIGVLLALANGGLGIYLRMNR